MRGRNMRRRCPSWRAWAASSTSRSAPGDCRSSLRQTLGTAEVEERWGWRFTRAS
jgi:hypothetical protein